MIAIIHKARYFLTVLMAVYFVFPLLWASYLIGLWSLLSVVFLILNIKKISKQDALNFVVLSAPFFLLIIISLFYRGDYSKLFERALSFIVFPLFIFMGGQKLNSSEWKWLSRVFIFGLIFLCFRGFLQFLFQPLQFVYTEHHDFIFKYRNEFNSNTGIAPTYASMYMVFGMIILMLEVFKNGNLKWLNILVLIFFAGNLILLSAKMPILSLGVLMIMGIFSGKLKGAKSNYKRTLLLAIVVLTGVITLLAFTRWNEVITFMSYSGGNNKENSVGIRKMINECNLELAGENFLKGVGPLNVQQELNRCYYQFEGDDLFRHTFNTHNQYFDYLLAFGIVGLVVILILALYPLWVGLRRRDVLLFSFSVITIMCMLTENILSRQSGVVFYCLFFALLINRVDSNKKTPESTSGVLK